VARCNAGVTRYGSLRHRGGPRRAHDDLGDPFEDGRNGRIYLSPCLASHAPIDLLVLMLGTNDLKCYFPLTAPDIAHGMATLVDDALRSRSGPDLRPPQILIVSPVPLAEAMRLSDVWGFGAAAEESRRLADCYATVAEDRGCAMFDAGSIASVDPIDGIHLDADSHRGLGIALAGEVRGLLRHAD
jgi:lysophospholipase L1-like esterase